MAKQRIEFTQNGIYAGSGILQSGVIRDCGVVWSHGADESKNVYELIEGAIDDGKSTIGVQLDGNFIRIAWIITNCE